MTTQRRDSVRRRASLISSSHDMPRNLSLEFSLPELDRRQDADREPVPSRNPTTLDSSTSWSESLMMQQDEDLPEYAERVFSQFMVFTVPSYLQHHVTGGEPNKPKKLHDIAALDGLRGWACLLVFNFHFFFTYTWHTHIGWGFNKQYFGLHQLPFIHMIFSGHIMVAIFFVISGYVLSYRPLKTIRSGSFEQTFAVLSSATFRRGLRLYIPSIVGLYNYSRWVVDNSRTITGTNEQHPIILRSTYIQLWDWYNTICRLMNFWDWGLYYNNYNPHLWTIPVEFRSSIVLFVTILAVSRFRTKVRLILEILTLWFCIRWGRWDVVLFLSGLLLAEIDLENGIWNTDTTTISKPESAPATVPDLEKLADTTSIQNFLRRRQKAIWIGVFILGLYIGSSPNIGGLYTPGYVWLARITPKTYPEPHRFPQTLGAVMIVASINNSKTIQKIFINPLSQYLGQISYAFYIVHGPILHGLGYTLMHNIWQITGRETTFQFLFGAAIGWSICLPIALWLADIFWRAVDVPSVRFARQLESELLAKFQVSR
ncbi:acyltransferase, putative [Talaromyces stipitatus ATCC 10500]|uniref:Acyltransferase, putative n=1 Tax=Talaromyces stipitatus (strain ATCC 10500 / CBS 375.48 / QM 6759 / NRRL 1006) TaxID=441959 RepID=B8MHV0_TALSN|nr:acyltransferase, putative [Talaromyces stipitatus ATCC 10500]EED16430.1 acyltransferase, putative [Talaromyces stipitatus ATCC 10500]